MALRLVYSSNATDLVEHLVDSLGQPDTPPGSVIPVLMPSIPLVDRVKTSLAKRYGVAMGVAFLLPNAFTDSIGNMVGLGPVHSSWQPTGLFWRLLPILTTMADGGRSSRLQAACKNLSACISLAAELADRFDQYLYFRPSMIAAWDRGENWKKLPPEAREDETWQRDLWRHLTGTLRDHPHPAARLSEITARVVAGKGKLPASIQALTTGPLPPALLPLIRGLAGQTQVCLRALMPSTEYLGDIRAGRTQMRTGSAIDPDWEANPLLSHLGKQALDTFQSFELELVVDGQEYEGLNKSATASGTLLAQLQADIRGARQPEPGPSLSNLMDSVTSDRSIRVHRCHGARREAEVVKDELLDAFGALPGLRADEILILAPELDTYAPLAEAVLGEGVPALPLYLSEHRIDRSDPVVRGLQMALNLAKGRAHLSEGLAFVESTAVTACLESLDIEPLELEARLRASGITWGLNASHRQKMGAGETETGTWREGLDRLLSGLWLGNTDRAVDIEGRPVLPTCGALAGDPTATANALDWLAGLLRILEEWQVAATPATWADRWNQALTQVLGARIEGCELGAASDLIDQLRAGETQHNCRLLLDVTDLADWCRKVVKDGARSIARVGGGIAMGGFKPMRAIPCRVLVVMGLHDSAFPRRTRPQAWDLLSAAPQRGDRNPAHEDRQLFLDAILAAKDRVILTATARNIRTDKKEPLSACLDEFLDTAAHTVSPNRDDVEQIREMLIEDAPLQPFSPSNFQGIRPSFDEGSLKIARAVLEKKVDTESFQSGLKSPPKQSTSVELDLEELIRLLREPWVAWLDSLNISLPRRADDPMALDREPLSEPTQLTRWRVQTHVIESLLTGNSAFLVERLAADRLIPYSLLGRAMSRECIDQATAIAHRALETNDGGIKPLRLVYHQGNRHLSGTIGVNRAESRQVLPEAGDLQKRLASRFPVWVRANFAAACDKTLATQLIYRDGEGVKTTLLQPIPVQQARSAIDFLMDLCKEAQLRPLPFGPRTSSAIFEAVRQGQDPKEKARIEWEKNYFGVPGEGDKASAQLSWRGQDPFAGTVLEEWHQFARAVFEPLTNWFNNTQPISNSGQDDA